MGKALMIKDTSFAEANLGAVTPLENVPVTAIAIVGPDAVEGATDAQVFSVSHTPENTTQRIVLWSIVNGNEYASINQRTGMLSVAPGASESSVTIMAVSVYDQSVLDTKTITVTFDASAGTIWDKALVDPDFAEYMAEMSVLYQGADITKNGNERGTAITEPLSSASQNFVFLIDVTIEEGGGSGPALVTRLGTSFCIAQVSGVWKIGGTWSPPYSFTLTQSRVTLYVYYDKANATIVVKNITEGTLETFTNANAGAWRDTSYIGGGESGANDFKGTIHQVYIGG